MRNKLTEVRDQQTLTSNKLMTSFLKVISLFLALSASMAVGATIKEQQQSNKILAKGIVVDDVGIPVIGASVILDGTSNVGTITDIDGAFSLNVPLNSMLTISYIGYKTQKIKIDSETSQKVTLSEDRSTLDEVVVIGYGTQRKSDLTGGIVSISGDEIGKINAVSLSQRLQGQVAGMNITNTDAKPGEDGSILIRGKKTLRGSTSPLIILDGIPFGGNMSEIDQNSVESISVLKDASSAAIYGARAANGVILVTSKKGVVGKPTVRYNGYVGFQQAERLLNLMKGDQYLQFSKDYRKDTGDPTWDDPLTYFQAALHDNYRNGLTYDWRKEAFRTAMQMEHQVSVSGASEATNYYISATYTDQESIKRNAGGYKKYAVTANISQSIGQWVKAGTSIQLSERNRGGFDPYTSHALKMSPYASIKNEDGEYIRYPMYGETLYYSPYANYGMTNDDKSRGAYLNGFVQVDAPWVKGLSYRANVGYSYRHRDVGKYYPTTTMTGEATNGKAEVEAYNYGGWTVENIITYDATFDKHKLNVTGLYSAEKQYSNNNKTEAQDFISDTNEYHNLALAKGMKKISSEDERKQLLAWMGRINYSYDSKYLLTLTGRRDGASVYGKGNKWGFFPSVAAGWVLTQESFIKNLDIKQLEFLKLRASYGVNGNIYNEAYKSFNQLTDQDYIFGNDNILAGGLISGFTYANPNLKWERSKTFNLGIDFHLFDNSRIHGSIDYYNAKTSNLLMSRSVPIMNGYDRIEDNVGEIQNRGIEFTLNTSNIRSQDFEWNTTLILTRNWDKILELQRDANGNHIDDVANKWFVNSPVNVYYDYKVIGIWQESEREQAAKYKAVPGDAKLYDADDNGSINGDDRVVIGSKSPQWTAGLTNTFRYKNVSLSMFINSSFGAWHENATIKFERLLFEKNSNYVADIDYWTPENPSNKYTRLGYKDTRHTFYKKVNFVRLQDVSLSYTFPKSMLAPFGVKELTTYVSGRNLVTISNANKYTMNIEREAYNDVAFPSQRSFFLGVNLTF